MLQTATARKSDAANLCHTVGNRDVGQTCTFRKSSMIDTLDPVRYDNALKSRAVTKGKPSNGVDMGRNGDATQTAAILKRVLINYRYTVRKSNLGKATTSFECGVPNRGHPFGDGDRRHITATVKRTVTNRLHTSVSRDHTIFTSRDDLFCFGTDQAVSVAVIGLIILRYRDRSQLRAIRKRESSDALHLGRYLHARQTAARAKGSVLYIG